jgi:hypothetical protein
MVYCRPIDIATGTGRGNSFCYWSLSDLKLVIKITLRYFLLADASRECEESISPFSKENTLEPVKKNDRTGMRSAFLFYSFLFFSFLFYSFFLPTLSFDSILADCSIN